MEPKGPLPHSQLSATCPYPEPVNAVHAFLSDFLQIHSNIIFPSAPMFLKFSPSLGSPPP